MQWMDLGSSALPREGRVVPNHFQEPHNRCASRPYQEEAPHSRLRATRHGLPRTTP
jgi:hypothetical protein